MDIEEQLREVTRRQHLVFVYVALSVAFAIATVVFSVASLLTRHC